MGSKKDFFPSKYLAKEDLDGPKVVRIAYVKAESMPNEDENKPVAHFVEDLKPMILNSGNYDTVKGIAGSDEWNQWKNVPVTVYVNPDVEYKGKRTGGLRLRPVTDVSASQPEPPADGPPHPAESGEIPF